MSKLSMQIIIAIQQLNEPTGQMRVAVQKMNILYFFGAVC
jgi:hypothetical protein